MVLGPCNADNKEREGYCRGRVKGEQWQGCSMLHTLETGTQAHAVFRRN